MPDDLSPAAPEDVIQSLSFALRFNRGTRSHQHDQVMAEAAAAHLLWSNARRRRTRGSFFSCACSIRHK